MSSPGADSVPLVLATMLRQDGRTGVHTHARQLRRYLDWRGAPPMIVTPFSWSRALAAPVFGARLPLRVFSRPAGVVWYRHWHAAFLTRALRRSLSDLGECVVYAQGPLAARSVLRARQGPHQRVVLAVHFRTSQADEWSDKHEISRDGAVYGAIRRLERDVIPQVDGIVYVSDWARRALLGWLPEAAAVPHAVIDNFVAAPDPPRDMESLADLVTVGHLEPVKNHRYLLHVLAEAKRVGRTVSLDVYGAGPLRRDLLRQTRSLGLEGHVRFRGFRTDLPALLPRYKAYAHVSYSESSSLAIIEAMAAGLPILAAPIGPIGELFDDGIEGRFWPLDDPAAAACILDGLLGDEPARLAAAGAANRRFRHDFDAAVVAPRLRSFLFGFHAGGGAANDTEMSRTG
jgi:glycosyltransferase involved in cell wall biosynthesis